MRSKGRPTKRDAILDAMLDVVVERGLHDAPMSLVAARSGASAGVIYYHFASKEEIIQAVYEQVRALKRAGLLKGYSPAMDAKEALIKVWTNAYYFYREHLRELRFLDQYENAGLLGRSGATALPDTEPPDFARRFQGRSQGGVLIDWPPEVLQEMTLGLAARLARQPRELSPDVLRGVAEKVWEAVGAVK